MTYTVIFLVENGSSQKIEVSATGKDAASIVITAASLQEAVTLLPEGEAAALDAIQAWTQPAQAPEQQTHFLVSGRTIEDMAAGAENYENSQTGQRFIRTLANAKAFSKKHQAGGCIGATQLYYLANKHQNSLINGSADLIALAYRKGYKDGKAAK